MCGNLIYSGVISKTNVGLYVGSILLPVTVDDDGW